MSILRKPLALLLALALVPSFALRPTPVTAAGGAQAGVERPQRESDEVLAARGHLVGHGGPVKAVAAHREAGRIISGGFDYAMMAWDVTGERPRLTHRLDQHEGAVNAVAFLGDGRQALSAGDDGSLRIWNLETGALVKRLEGHEGKIVGLAVSEDGRWAATASWDRTVRLWNLETHEAGPVLTGHRGPVNAVQFSQDGATLYTASYDGEIRAFTTASGALERPVYRHGWGINVLARLPEREEIAFGALNGTIAIVSAETGAVVTELESGDRPILSLAVTDKPGLIAFGASDGVVRVHRIDDMGLIEQHQNPYGPVWAMAFSPDGQSLYLGGLDDFVSRWQITPREPFEPVDSPFPRRFQLSEAGDTPIERGRIQFARKCSVCHTLVPDGQNRAGPTLSGIFGRRIAAIPDYPYSASLRSLDIVWTEETVSKLFELGPDVFTPGSKMPLQKMTDAAQRADLIAFLRAATMASADPQDEAPTSNRTQTDDAATGAASGTPDAASPAPTGKTGETP